MKKSVLFVVFATIVLVFASCKEDKSDWKKFYGYTANEIGGTYSYSNASDAFKSLTESEFCHLCPDANITITPTDDNTIRFVMNSEELDYYKLYMGKAPLNSHDFMIDIKGNTQTLSSLSFIVYNLSARVYKNPEGKIRLEGNSAANRYNIKQNIIYDSEHVPVDTIYDTILYSTTRYYFDVIKN